MDECCVACLSDNQSSFAGVNEKESVEDFLCEKLPSVFTNYPVILCNGCMFQLEKFRNFRRNVQNSISTLTKQLNKIYSCRVFVEPIGIFLEATPYAIKEENMDDTHQHDDSDDEMEGDPPNSVSPFTRTHNSQKVKKLTAAAKVTERKRSTNRLRKGKHQESTQGGNESDGSLLEGEPNRDTSIKMEALVDYGSSQDQWDANNVEAEDFSDASDNETQTNETKKDYRVERASGKMRVYTECKGKTTKWHEYIKKHKNKLPSRKLFTNNQRPAESSEKCSDFQCDHCPYTAKKKYNMREHVKLHFNPSLWCDICSQSFTTYRSLKIHEMAHYDLKALSCELCSKSFVSKNGLKHHTQSKHANERFICDECGKVYSFKSGLMKHKKCDHSPFTAKKQNNMREHVKLPFNRSLWCDICSQSFPTYRSLKIHKMTHYDQKAFQCELCSKSFVSRNGLKFHTQGKHTNEQFICDECGKVFNFKSGLVKHKKEGEKRSCKGYDIDCSLCGVEKLARTYRTHVIAKHATIVNGKHFCAECDLECSSEQSLVYHFDTHRKLSPPWKCEQSDCTEVLDNMKEYKRHIEAHRFKKEFACPKCDNKYYHVTSLQFHYMNIHTKALMCRFCKLVFELKEDYDRHLAAETQERRERKRLIRYTKIRLAHEKEKEEKLKQGITMDEDEDLNRPDINELPMVFSRPLTKVNAKKATKTYIPKLTKMNQKIYCHICRIDTKNFKNHVTEAHATKLATGGYSCNVCHSCLKDNYSIHFSQMHREYPSVQKCSECDFSSLRHEPMRKHLITHKRGLFECHYCGSSYTEKTSLRYHMFFKHTSLYICNFCNKTFEEQSIYKEHMIEEKAKRKGTARVCAICGFTTMHANYLKGHMIRVHGDNRTDSVICPTCGKKCKSVLNLKDHVLNVHGERNAVCTQCGKRFRNQAYLREHIKNAHSTEILKCQMCEKVGTPIQLKRHVYMCHDTKRPWACKMCNMTFKIKAGLQKHLHTHAGTRPFVCHICTQGFYNREVLEKHLNEIHKLNLTRDEIREICKRIPSMYEKEHMEVGESNKCQ